MADSVEKLCAETENLRSRLAECEAELKNLRYENDTLSRRVATLESDNKFLKVSHRLASSPDDLAEARRMVSGLIRNIDKCISELKE